MKFFKLQLSTLSIMSIVATGAVGNISETGQSAFAAIAEITAALDSASDTDWDKINIDNLVTHLRDMNLVTLRSTVARQKVKDSIIFHISGAGDTSQAIYRMVQAHAPFLQTATGWKVTFNQLPDGARLRVQANTQAELSKISALGFYGLLTLGAHHPQHHFIIAKGHSGH